MENSNLHNNGNEILGDSNNYKQTIFELIKCITVWLTTN